jgi:hypothetical protein
MDYNLWLNVRFFSWHIQWEFKSWFPTIVFNPYHTRLKYPCGYFQVYEFKFSKFVKHIIKSIKF